MKWSSMALVLAGLILWGPACQKAGTRAVLRLDPLKTVGVIKFYNLDASSQYKWLESGLALSLIGDLYKQYKVNVKEQIQLEEKSPLLSRLIQFRDLKSPAVMRKAARTLKLDYLVFGEYQVNQRKQIFLTLFYLDVAGEKDFQTIRLQGDLSQLLDLQNKMILQLMEKIGISLSAEEQADIFKEETKNLRAYEYLSLGYQEHLRDRFEEAKRYYILAQQEDQNYLLPYLYLGVLYDAHLGDAEQALASFDKARRYFAKQPLVYHFLGDFYFHQKDFSKAIESYEQCLSLDPRYVNVYYNLGTVYQALAQEKPLNKKIPLKKALAYYRLSLACNNRDFESLNHVGSVFYQLGKKDSAAVYYEKALAVNPDYPEANCNWGLVLNEEGKFPNAIAAYEKALNVLRDDSRHPLYLPTVWNLAVAYEKMETDSCNLKAINSWNYYLNANPFAPDAKVALAHKEALLNKGKKK